MTVINVSDGNKSSNIVAQAIRVVLFLEEEIVSTGVG